MEGEGRGLRCWGGWGSTDRVKGGGVGEAGGGGGEQMGLRVEVLGGPGGLGLNRQGQGFGGQGRA